MPFFWVAAGAAVIGTGVSMYGASVQADAANNQAQYQAQVAQNNQIIANRQATAATQAGEIQAQTKLLQTAAMEGKVRAAAAANGLDPNQGTPVDLQSDTAKLGTLDALTIRNNAARTAYGYQIQAGNAQGQQGLALAAGQNAESAGSLNMFSDFLSGASSVSSKWSSYKTNIASNPTGSGISTNSAGVSTIDEAGNFNV
ncbi:MAG: hypothetical protein JWL84_316 [Rhodospirillales bacterium]|nr:hypothetical protein [Rhodospirillales bacterium]